MTTTIVKHAFRKLFVIIVLAVALGGTAKGQTVSGVVTDANTDEGIPGANIVVQGTTVGTTTDIDGYYELEVPSVEDTLQVSYVGYRSEEVPIDGREEIDIALEEDVVMGEELVVVGYGVQSRETATGSVSAVSGSDIEKSPVANVSNALAGRVPGLVSTQGSGEPGYDDSSIQIRGSNTLGDNDPLVVIDGVPSREGGLARLNPQDIENISVLKDASAAIYGSQAANGVILVTTRRGTSGAPQFNLNVNHGFNQPTRIPEMADAATYLTMLNEIDMYNGRDPSYSEERIEAHQNGEDEWLYPDTDWFGEVLKPMSMQSRVDLSVSGGSDDLQYYLSMGAMTQDGYYRNSATRYNQFNFRSNIDGQLSEHIELGFDVTGRLEDRNFPTRGAGEIFRATMRGKPHLPAYWPSGEPGPDIEYGDNPVVIGTPETGYNDDNNYVLQSNLSFDVDLPWVEGLSLESNFAYDVNFRPQRTWQTPWLLYTLDEEHYEETGEPELNGAERGFSEPQLYEDMSIGQDLLFNLVANYERESGDHYYQLMAGSEHTRFMNTWTNAFRRHFISDEIDRLFAGGESELDNDGGAEQGSRLNFFSRVNYGYKERYNVELVGRVDGSYIFPEGSRYGFFPSISLGWRLSEEPFFDVDFFDDLRLRASYGQTGNDRIDEWQYLATYGFGSGYVFGVDNEVTSLYPTRIPNEDVTWEVANQYNVALEGTVLNERVSFELDAFYYMRNNILWWRSASIPQTAGFSLPRENIGEVANRGIDGRVSLTQPLAENATLNVTANLGYAQNRINYWDEAEGTPEHQQHEGYPMPDDPTDPTLYYNVIGVFQSEDEIDDYPSWPDAQPGDLIFEDYDGDGEITPDDRVRVDRTSTPPWTGGLNFDLTYGQFDVNMLWQGAAGGAQYVFTESGEIGNYLQEFAENRWTPDNPSDEHPRTFNRGDEYWASQANTYWLRSNDYVRLKNLEIGYVLPTGLSETVGLDRLRVYASGHNLLTFDKLGVMDPETSSDSGQYYPQQRVFNMGLTMSF